MDRDRPLVTRPQLSPVATAAVLAVPILFLGYFFAYPLVSIVVRGLSIDGGIDLSVFKDVVTDDTLRRVATFTVVQALISTAVTVAIGLPTAWVFARFDFPGKRLLSAATLVPFVLPTLVVGMVFLNLLGPRSIVDIDITGSMGIIVLAHVFYNFAIVVRGVSSFWARIDPSLESAARTLGANPTTAFRTVTLPLLAPAIASTSSLVFLFSFTSFGVILLLGDLSATTIEVEIWRQATAFLRLDVASALAVLQLVGVGLILVVYGWLERTTASEFRHHVVRPRKPSTPSERRWVGTIVTAAMLFLGIPLGLLIARSLAQPSGGYGLENYANIVSLPDRSAAFIEPIEAVGNSLRFAGIAVVIGLVVGMLTAVVLAYADRRVARGIDTFVMLPLGTSAVTIGFGFLIALDRPVDLRTSVLLIPIAHALVAIPFVVRSVSPTFASIQHRLREAAATLGANRWQVFATVDARLVARSMLVGAAFAFAISMGEFGATTFIARPATPTIPLAIFRLLGRPGSVPYGAALALSVVLLVITAAVIIVIDLLRRDREGAL
ncbi:MAG: iron ABC transporter permease [Acidimicrobiia bacterium]|nr:iron ABC transporter permease [Acidimicrobiia bacterium]